MGARPMLDLVCDVIPSHIWYNQQFQGYIFRKVQIKDELGRYVVIRVVQIKDGETY